ncbi:MAG TPA: hypothetical protein VK427_24360 [Kofleriaceae bacterium]|nr:hypothetical protein [Kofleriaceae bacterium]
MHWTRVVVGLLASTTVVVAEPGDAQPLGPPPPPPPLPGEAAPEIDAGIAEDASSGRNWLTPTALTPPAGTWWISSHDLVVASMGYAATDRVTMSATVLLPLDTGFVGAASIKAQLVRVGHVRAAVQLLALHVSDGDSDLRTSAAGGTAITLCLDTGCHSHATGYIGAGYGVDTDVDDNRRAGVAAAGLTLRITPIVKVVLEADIAVKFGDTDDFLLASYGVRFTAGAGALDLGLAKPICSSCSVDDFPLGFPLVSFTYRSYNSD